MSRDPAAILARLRRAARARRRAEAGYRALILEAAELGLPHSAIAAAAGCSRQNVQQILRRPTTVEGRARAGPGPYSGGEPIDMLELRAISRGEELDE